MLPVVDAHMWLAPSLQSLQRYLSLAREVHLLRAVAVQSLNARPRHIVGKAVAGCVEHGADELDAGIAGLVSVARTRGSGGLPNGIVACCDLDANDADARLLALAACDQVRGIVHAAETHRPGTVADAALPEPRVEAEEPPWLHKLPLLAAAGLCLDLQLDVHQLEWFGRLQRPLTTVPIIVEVAGLRVSNDGSVPGQVWRRVLSVLAARPNVSLKLTARSLLGTGWSPTDLQAWLSLFVEHLGAERVMLGSGYPSAFGASSFDALWSLYSVAMRPLSARQRGCLLRTTAMQVYRL